MSTWEKKDTGTNEATHKLLSPVPRSLGREELQDLNIKNRIQQETAEQVVLGPEEKRIRPVKE